MKETTMKEATMDEMKRQTGRTTRALREALEHAQAGERVLVTFARPEMVCGAIAILGQRHMRDVMAGAKAEGPGQFRFPSGGALFLGRAGRQLPDRVVKDHTVDEFRKMEIDDFVRRWRDKHPAEALALSVDDED